MAVLGPLLRNKRPAERNHTWNDPRLAAPETMAITSPDFVDGGSLDVRHAGRRVGGGNVSPRMAWSPPPAGTAELLLLVEDLDAPLGSRPPVHCLALIEPTILELPPGALSKDSPAPGVTLLRSTIGRGYSGPEPLKGHGPHRYVFQLYALGDRLLNDSAVLKARPRAVLDPLPARVLARGRITGTHER